MNLHLLLFVLATTLGIKAVKINHINNKRNEINIPVISSLKNNDVEKDLSSLSQYACDPACVYGECIEGNVCVCKHGYTGPACDKNTCDCIHGICNIETGECKCDEKWYGKSCENPVCSIECQNGGTCINPDECVCTPEYTGASCSEPVCSKGCVNGKCVNPETCECEKGFTGLACDLDRPTDCRFPFIYKDNFYFDCIRTKDVKYSWCSSNTIYSGGEKIKCSDEILEIKGDIKRRDLTETLSNINDKSLQVCTVTDGQFYNTFDNKYYSATGKCTYEIIEDCSNEFTGFKALLMHDEDHVPSVKIVSIELTLELKEGKAYYDNNEIDIPSIVNGIHVEYIPDTKYIVVYGQFFGMQLKWNGASTFMFTITDPSQWTDRLCGLCGNYNGYAEDDLTPKGRSFVTEDVALFMDSWIDNTVTTGYCSTPKQIDSCVGKSNQQILEFSTACVSLKNEDAFRNGDEYVSSSMFNQLCVEKLCTCSGETYEQCFCEFLGAYSEAMVANGANINNWRNPGNCQKNCTGGRIWKECGSSCPTTCENRNRMMTCEVACSAGCFCPEGMILNHVLGECVDDEACTCSHEGGYFENKSVRSSLCEQCTCNNGIWNCEALDCLGECSVTGNQHYRTFDLKYYKFHGDCQYVLATDKCAYHSSHAAFTVTGENFQCTSDGCLKSTALFLGTEAGDKRYILKEMGFLFIDGLEVGLPYEDGFVQAYLISDEYVTLKTLSGDISIEWDGKQRIYLKLSEYWKDRVCGLCGNYNGRSDDDYVSRDNIIENHVNNFGNSWKTTSNCMDVECHAQALLPEACLISKQIQIYAETNCAILTSETFAECHGVVSSSLYYTVCRSDVCESSGSEMVLCRAIAEYSRECQKNGVVINWRNDNFCSIKCNSGKTYKECGSLCKSTCTGLHRTCSEEECAPGCFCPQDTFWSQTQNACVEKEDCECLLNTVILPAGVSFNSNSMSCTCTNGHTMCVQKYSIDTCHSNHVYFDCINSTESLGVGCIPSCRNPEPICTQQCISGCVCPKDTLLDENTKTCVEKSECTCVHNGKVYKLGESMTTDNGYNYYTCSDGGIWINSITSDTPAECFAAGDPHYTTFDGRKYSFQGDCSYILAQDSCNNKVGTFRITVENLPCGNSDVTCTKEVNVYFYDLQVKFTKGEGQKIYTETKGNDNNLTAAGTEFQYNILKGTIYYILETNIGVNILWNHNNAVKVKLDPSYAGRVCGLCGNFDHSENNDFTTPAGDLAVDENTFGQSWKLRETCPVPSAAADPCDVNPYRRPWAEKKCKILMSKTFGICHAYVDPTPFYLNCVSDTCACDQGGDCDCFCTAIAVYVQICGELGFCITWRNSDLCPIMCESLDDGYGFNNSTCQWHFLPCGNPHPEHNCEINQSQKHCPWCHLEGCYPQCPEDEFWSVESQECVPCITTPLPTTPETTQPTTFNPTTVVPTTAEPTTQKPTSVEPTTQKPTTVEPTTQRPTTVKPTTQRPTTAKPTTQKPTTIEPTTFEPTTQRPTTVKPTTQKPTTVEPTTQKSTTVEPTTQKPTTVEPTTQRPTTVEPTTQKPTTVEPTTQKPTTVEPTTQKPTTVEPTTQKPTTVEPTTQSPTTAEPTTVEPTTKKTTTVEPTTQSPTTVEPTTVQPTTAEPTTQQPTTVEPTTQKRTTVEPTTQTPPTVEQTTQKPTTVEPTTQKSTTVEPTTAEPTTQRLSTVEPTTQKHTTVEPTKHIPTTVESTTVEPTTAEPTTQRPTTHKPTTIEPTTQRPTTVEPTTPCFCTDTNTGHIYYPNETWPFPADECQTITCREDCSKLLTNFRVFCNEDEKPCPDASQVFVNCTCEWECPSTTQRSTTFESTTAEPTTQRPTTQKQTTQKPTTVEPTTQKITTVQPTTAEPTTQRPTTQKPTTVEPTTQRRTTVEATTSCFCTDTNTGHIYYPNETWPFPGDECQTITCREDCSKLLTNFRVFCNENKKPCPDASQVFVNCTCEWECPSTTPQPTTTSAEITTVKPCECEDPDTGFIYQPGDTWSIDECKSMECTIDCSIVVLSKRKFCKEANKPVCENGLPAIQVQIDECTCEWQCQCYCQGQGDPHFISFDGFYYPFQGNCTYLLARDWVIESNMIIHTWEGSEIVSNRCGSLQQQ